MTNLDILEGHIERQSEICAAAALRLEVLLLARHVLKGGAADAPYAVALQVDPASVSLVVQMQGGAQAGIAAELLNDVAQDVAAADVSAGADAVPSIDPVEKDDHAPAEEPESDAGPAPVIDNRAALAREWSPEEIIDLRRRFAAGESPADIARALNKSAKQVSNKTFRLGLRRGKVPCDQALPVASVPSRSTAHATPKLTAKSKPNQTIAQRLDQLGKSKVWTLERDLILALSFVRGESAAKIGAAMKLDTADVTDRWQALCPNRNDKAAINALVRELKVRANV
ncbi:helix-turn-helix domain-containing protein [Loktanella sp. M215]|uniref:helix-turn-helix domain-containing protein n=1 Tax=Loktanella sp. M215 TaxID=2675431 RepID=UPI001F18FB9B|nr:helix-turn-helix domain-containing protein [Loktanella sp. M215]MCF7700531.1 hypothetical protein [Loktanella sp. M215]